MPQASWESTLPMFSSSEKADSSDFNFFNKEQISFSSQCEMAVLHWKYTAVDSHFWIFSCSCCFFISAASTISLNLFNLFCVNCFSFTSILIWWIKQLSLWVSLVLSACSSSIQALKLSWGKQLCWDQSAWLSLRASGPTQGDIALNNTSACSHNFM